jgi:hypothetical protein
LEKIFCLAWIIGESRDSGHVPGLDEKSKKREIMDDFRTILGRNIAHVSDSRSGLEMGEFFF